MRVLVQRVRQSRVDIEQQTIGSIGQGLTLLVGIAKQDTMTEVEWMVQKCLTLRLFPGTEGDRMDRSVTDIHGDILVVSQFTLYGDSRKGRRPSFEQSAPPAQAQVLYEQFVEGLRSSSLTIETGQFGAKMNVFIDNDGPVTLMLEREHQSP